MFQTKRAQLKEKNLALKFKGLGLAMVEVDSWHHTVEDSGIVTLGLLLFHLLYNSNLKINIIFFGTFMC